MFYNLFFTLATISLSSGVGLLAMIIYAWFKRGI